MGYFAQKRVLVTGGTGLIGRQVMELLARQDARVVSVSRDKLYVERFAVSCYGDLRDFEFCKAITSRQDVVFHLAGVKGSPIVTKNRPASFMTPMLQMNTNVLEAARVNGVQRVLFASSIGAYPAAEEFTEPELGGWAGAPMDEYPGWAKLAAEKQIEALRKEFGLHLYSIVRPSNVYGPGDNFDSASAMVIPALIARAYGGETPLKVWGDGSAVRDFVYSRDVAEGMLAAVASETSDLLVNLGSGVEHTVRDVAEIVSECAGVKVEFHPEMGENTFSRRVMSIMRARTLFGYNPQTSLLDGIRETWDWFVAHPRDYLLKQNYFREWAPHASQRVQ